MKQPMYQCHVTSKDEQGRERQIPVGPRCNTTLIPEKLCEQINMAVVAGKERSWHDARVVQVDNAVH